MRHACAAHAIVFPAHHSPYGNPASSQTPAIAADIGNSGVAETDAVLGRWRRFLSQFRRRPICKLIVSPFIRVTTSGSFIVRAKARICAARSRQCCR